MKSISKYKSCILTLIISGIIFSSLGVYAATIIGANEVAVSSTHTDKTNVKDSLDELYNMSEYGTATASDILTGKTALVNGKQIIGTYSQPSGNLNIEANGNYDVTGYASTTVNVSPTANLQTETKTSQATTNKGYAHVTVKVVFSELSNIIGVSNIVTDHGWDAFIEAFSYSGNTITVDFYTVNATTVKVTATAIGY